MNKTTHLHIIPNTNPQINHTLHNHATSLLQLPHNPRQGSINNRLHLILLLGLLVLCLLRILVRGMLRRLVRRVRRHHGLATREIDIDPAGVFLGGILQAQLATDLLDTRLDFLDVARGVVTLADDAGYQLVQLPSPKTLNGEHGDKSTYTCK